MALDYYELLGVDKSANDAQLRKAYKKMAIKYHPDKNPDNPEAEEMFKKIAEVYNVLCDPEKRQIYDNFGEEGLNGNETGINPANIDPHEVFRQFFRGFTQNGAFAGSFNGDPFGAFSFKRTANGGIHHPFARVIPRVVKAELPCTLEELYQGTIKRMKIRRHNIQAARPEVKVLEIEVKPGWKANTKITFRGEGDEVRPGEFQDIMFVVIERKHKRFHREGHNLIYHKRVSLVDALAGFDLNIELLDGSKYSTKIDDVVQPGSTKVIAGRGMPHSRRPNTNGDLVVRFDVLFPDKLDDTQKKKIRATL